MSIFTSAVLSVKLSWRITGMRYVRCALPLRKPSTSIVTSLMFGPTELPSQRPVSSQSTFRICRPCALASVYADWLSVMSATFFTIAWYCAAGSGCFFGAAAASGARAHRAAKLRSMLL